jgi:hypothetical protein
MTLSYYLSVDIDILQRATIFLPGPFAINMIYSHKIVKGPRTYNY